MQYKRCLATLTSSVLRGHTVGPDSRRNAWRAHFCQSGAGGSPSTGGRPRPSSPYITCRAQKGHNAAWLENRHAAWLKLQALSGEGARPLIAHIICTA